MLISLGRLIYILKDIIWSLEYPWFQLPSGIVRPGITLQVDFNRNPTKFLTLLQHSKLTLSSARLTRSGHNCIMWHFVKWHLFVAQEAKSNQSAENICYIFNPLQVLCAGHMISRHNPKRKSNPWLDFILLSTKSTKCKKCFNNKIKNLTTLRNFMMTEKEIVTSQREKVKGWII